MGGMSGMGGVGGNRGGIGGARFLLGVQRLLGLGQFSGQLPATATDGEHQLTAVVNVGDDAWMFGVRICPDLDTITYTLGRANDTERGWGLAGETWHAIEALERFPALFQGGASSTRMWCCNPERMARCFIFPSWPKRPCTGCRSVPKVCTWTERRVPADIPR